MAFAINFFNNVTSGAAAGPKFWAYGSTTDTLATIIADDYFLAVRGALTAGDQIFCLGSDGQGTFAVASSTSTTVTLGSSIGQAVARVTIPAAAVLLLATTQYELVAAPGAGNILTFEGCHIQLDWGTTAYTEAADNLTVNYTDDTGVVVSQIIEMTGFITLVADSSTRGFPVIDPIVANTGNENQALVLDNNNANFGNAGDSPLVIDTFFRVVSGV